jgi:N-acetylglutamate synthase-like GNAT family acetyltransferase
MPPKEKEIVVEGNNIELRGNKGYDIYLNDNQIGVIEGSYCYLESINIKPNKRDQGFGTEAVKLFIKIARKANCDEIKTSSVLNSGMEHILTNKFNFNRINEESNRFRKKLI